MFEFSNRSLPILDVYKQGFVLYKGVFSKIWYLVLTSLLVNTAVELVGSECINPLNKPLDRLLPSQLFAMSALSVAGFLVSIFIIALIMQRIYLFGSAADQSRDKSSGGIVLGKWFKLIVVELFVWTAITLGMFAFILPGVFLLILFSFCMPIILFEDVGILDALKGSYKLVWGNWWRTFVVFLLPGIIFISAVFSRYLIQTFGKGILVISLFNAFYIVFFTLFYGLIHTFIVIQYNDLKLRKQGI